MALRILLFAAAAPLLMRLKLETVGRLVGRRASREPDSDEVARVIRLTRAAFRYGRPLVRNTCLTRGLTLYHYLRRAGLDVELHFGAGFPNGAFAAHCWLVRDGKPYLERPGKREHFTAAYCFPGGPVRP